MRKWLAAGAIALLGACGNGGETGGDAAGSAAGEAPAPALAQVNEQFRSGCGQNSNLGEEACACVADLAQEELSPRAFAFLAATISGDDALVAQRRVGMTLEEITAAGMFMTRGPAQCAAADGEGGDEG